MALSILWDNINNKYFKYYTSNSVFFQVMIHDPSDEELYKLKVDISTGVATNADDLPPNAVIDEP